MTIYRVETSHRAPEAPWTTFECLYASPLLPEGLYSHSTMMQPPYTFIGPSMPVLSAPRPPPPLVRHTPSPLAQSGAAASQADGSVPAFLGKSSITMLSSTETQRPTLTLSISSSGSARYALLKVERSRDDGVYRFSVYAPVDRADQPQKPGHSVQRIDEFSSFSWPRTFAPIESYLVRPVNRAYNSEVVLCHPSTLHYENGKGEDEVWCSVLYPVSSILSSSQSGTSAMMGPEDSRVEDKPVLESSIFPVKTPFLKGFARIESGNFQPVKGDDGMGVMWKELKDRDSGSSVSADSLAAASDDDEEEDPFSASGNTEIICRICRDGVLLDVEPSEPSVSWADLSSNHSGPPPVTCLPVFAESTSPSLAPVPGYMKCNYNPPRGYKHNPLISPCQCTGSMSFVHLFCLESWRSRSRNPLSENGIKCETCRCVPPPRARAQNCASWHALF